MTKKPEEMYLDLLKKVLTFSLWAEPPIPIDAFNFPVFPMKRWLMGLLTKFLRSRHLEIIQYGDYSPEQKLEGMIWPTYGETMIGIKRLDNLQSCMQAILEEGIEGDFIEAGVWRGGACIFMRAVLAVYGIHDRIIYAADSFEGLPKPDLKKWPEDTGDWHHTNSFLAVSQQEVEANFRKYDLLDDQVKFIKGWFEDTLPQLHVEKFALIRLDGDMYGSTMDALMYLYPKLSNGGFCIIDDYALKGCRKAVDDYRLQNNISGEIVEVDWSGVYWRKT